MLYIGRIVVKKGMIMEALQRAVLLLGSQTKLAMAIGVRQQNIWAWLNRNKRVPAEFCKPIEEATDGEVKASELRPDVFKEAKQV